MSGNVHGEGHTGGGGHIRIHRPYNKIDPTQQVAFLVATSHTQKNKDNEDHDRNPY